MQQENKTKYNRNTIKSLDPRQLIYLSYHKDNYGTQDLIINGKDYDERSKENKPSVKEIEKIVNQYSDRELYLECNLRGWAIIIRNDSNETMYNWSNLEKIQ